MGVSVLVDSNVYIGLLRRSMDPVKVLGDWIGEGDPPLSRSLGRVDVWSALTC